MKRDFTPGSRWAYFKIYMGEKSADKILVGAIKPAVEALLREGAIDKFFFLRFSDPEFHLRVRFHLPDESRLAPLMAVLNEHVLPYYDGCLIRNIMMDTYKREIERYGEQNIETVEDIYCQDSVNTLSFLESISEADDREELRWLGALRYADDILDLFGCDLNKKHSVMEASATGFLREFGLNSAAYTKPLNAKYRTDRPRITRALKMETDLFGQISARNGSLGPIIDKLPGDSNLIRDIIHLVMNRIFVFEARKHEMVIYYYLNKYYESQISQNKYSK